MKRKLIIFDLDETLVHATETRLPSAPDFEVGPYFVHIRPFCDDLLIAVAERYDIAVWSSSSERYVVEVAKRIFGEKYPIKFAWSLEKCVQKVDPRSNSYVYIKDLRKVQRHGYQLEEIIIVDDSPEKIARQPRNHLQVKAFHGESDDTCLLEIRDALMGVE